MDPWTYINISPTGDKINWNGMELERKWNGKYFTKRNNVQWNGNRMEMER